MTNRLRALLYLVTAVALAPFAFALLLSGWLAVALLALTPLAVPALVAFRFGVRGLSGLEARLARTLLDSDVRLAAARRRGRGYWSAGGSVLADPAFWRQQVFLALRMTVGAAVAIVEVSVLASGLWLVQAPLSYRAWRPDLGFTRVDTLGKALVCVPIGVAAVVLGLLVLRPLAAAARGTASWLLGDRAGLPRPRRRLALAVHAAFYGIGAAVLVVIWALTTPHGYFWPEWWLLPVALPLAVHGWVELVDTQPRLRAPGRLGRGWAIHAGVAAAVSLFLVAVWAVTGAGYPWPVWPIGSLGLVLAVHALTLVVGGDRVRQLERTRAGAVEAQESELRRIERDLHDGAQARLVALGMTLGLAEQRLREDPEGARVLLAEARAGMGDALLELRDLARGIHPPILTDRGLVPALAAIADRSPLPVEIRADVPTRPPAPVETAAYFVAAEAIANAGKHAGATAVRVGLARHDGRLTLEVSDDGRGGADPEGRGLRGLRQRVEALDGTFSVESPDGGPTVVRAELPCAS